MICNMSSKHAHTDHVLNQPCYLNLLVCGLLLAEDPSENYVKLRDYVLVKLCQGLPSFAADKLHLGFSEDMVKEAQEKLKINKVMYETATNDYSVLCSIKSFV